MDARGVVNAGGVAFVGVVDDVLAIACTALRREEDAARHAAAAVTDYLAARSGGVARRLQERDLTAARTFGDPLLPPSSSPTTVVLAPAEDEG